VFGAARCKLAIREICGAAQRVLNGLQFDKGVNMLWLILGIVLLAIAIAGGAIVHPVLFALGILALFMFVSGWRGRTV
jgi:hypothetical protein